MTGPEAMAKEWQDAFGCRACDSTEELLQLRDIDFVFVFGSHREQPVHARMVLERGLACSIEKPGGLRPADIARLRDLARERGVFASVPFVNRLHPVIAEAAMLARDRGTPFVHGSFTDIAGTPERYLDARCDWMLDPDRAGGGCLINLGIHFIDLFAHLARTQPRLCGVALSNAVHRLAIEDHARVLLEADGGRTASVEVGYVHPDREMRHQAMTLVGEGWLVAAELDGTFVFDADGGRQRQFDLDAGPLYAEYVVATLEAFAAGKAPVADLEDLHRAMVVIDAAYASRR